MGEIEQEIGEPKALGPCLGLMELRRTGGEDIAAEQAGQQMLLVALAERSPWEHPLPFPSFAKRRRAVGLSGHDCAIAGLRQRPLVPCFPDPIGPISGKLLC